MPDRRASKRPASPAIKPKRKVPHDPGYQLLTGRPSSAVQDGAWDSLRHPTDELVERYGKGRFDLAISVRGTVQILEKLTRVKHWQPGLFSVSVDTKGNKYLDARWPGAPILELFTGRTRSRILEAKTHFSGCDLHPHFRLLCDAIERKPVFKIEGWSYQLEKIANDYFSEESHWKFANKIHIYQICDQLNHFFAHLYQSAREAMEKAKSFLRTSNENRRSLLQYAYHLLDGESQTLVAHLTIRRDTKVIGGGPPISRAKSKELREKFIKHVKREVPEENYLGHALLLKRDAALGCWLDAFIFFTKNAQIQDGDLMAKLVNRWNSEAGLGSAGCFGEILFEAHWDRDKRYGRTLDRIVLVADPNLYCRVSAEDAHRFWCTQSPIGKLTERTRQSKRREAQKKKAANTQTTPMSRLQEIALANQELLQSAHWTMLRERRNEKLSERNKKGAKTRSRQRRSLGALASGHGSTYTAAIAYASITAANDESHDQDRDRDTPSGPATSPAIVPENKQQQSRPSAESTPTMSSTDSTPTTTTPPHHQIRLERQHRDAKESSPSRERTKVEVRKKRKQRPESET